MSTATELLALEAMLEGRIEELARQLAEVREQRRQMEAEGEEPEFPF